MDKEAKQNKNAMRGKGMDWSKSNLYDALGRPDLKPENIEKKKQERSVHKSINRHEKHESKAQEKKEHMGKKMKFNTFVGKDAKRMASESNAYNKRHKIEGKYLAR